MPKRSANPKPDAVVAIEKRTKKKARFHRLFVSGRLHEIADVRIRSIAKQELPDIEDVIFIDRKAMEKRTFYETTWNSNAGDIDHSHISIIPIWYTEQ